jgi:cytochrome c-type biogenesis protein CcmH/NrfG
MKRLVLLIGLITSTLLTFAQSGVEVKIEPIEMMIGEQAQVTVTVQANKDDKVEFSTYQPRQQIVAGVEVIAAQHPSDNILQLTLTSFDGNLYYLPPFKVKVNGKTIESKSLALKVVEVEVDTTKLDKFFGPKDVQDNPFQWSDWSLSFWLSVFMLLLLAVAYYLYLRLRDNKPIMVRIKIVKRLLPHQKAMKEIEQIKADKMVNSENQKEYYTKLTDTLRKYIEERYGFSAMEMTSSEIIERLTTADDQQSLSELRQLFMTADLVKFAKYSTMINENDANLVNAIDFINQTKLENQPVEETVKPQLSEEDQRSQKIRRVLKTVIGGVIIISVLLFSYVVYSIYQLLN